MSGQAGRVGRMTISDIAERAGVSKGAVSYALNGRPGVSDETRDAHPRDRPTSSAGTRIAPHASLSAARADACGLVLARPARTLALEPFFMEFIAGVESELAARSIALTLQLVERRRRARSRSTAAGGASTEWTASSMVDLRVDDPRIEELVRLGLPAVVVGGPLPDRALPSVWHDEARRRSSRPSATSRRSATPGSPASRASTSSSTRVQRTAAFEDAPRELGLVGEVVATDYTPESGARATRKLLSAPSLRAAIVFDSDVLAVTGLGVVQQMGFAVPDDVSIVGWDDSLICQVVHPPLTAISRDIAAYGVAAGRQLLAAIEGGAAETSRRRAAS